MDALLDPLGQPFVLRAWLELALLAVPAGILGTLVVLRRLAFATHAFAVGAFPGVVVAAGIGVSAFLGGVVAALLLAGALAALGRRRDLDAAAATGILLAGALALGSLLVSDVYDAGAEVDTLLLGSLFGVGDADLVRAGVVLVLVAAALAVQGRGWLLLAFDADNARALGVRRGPHDLVLLALLALTVVAAVDAVGALLAASLLVIPAAAARLLTRRALPAMAVASGLALAAATGGILLSYHLDAPPGATVVLVAAGLFALAAVARRLAEPRRARRTLALAGAAVLLPLVLAACGGGDEAATATPAPPGAAGGQLQVVATTSIVADWARTVGGDRVHVTQILKPNVDPHDFEPGADAAKAVAEADVVLASGAGLDEWADDLVASGGGDARLVELAPEDELREPALQEQGQVHAAEHRPGDGDVDPHFWHDPTLASAAVGTLGQALAAADPADADAFRANAASYQAELARLDAELQEKTYASVPPADRKLVTDHDALGYLARHFGFAVVGAAIPSTSTAADASAGEIARLIDEIRAEHVAAVFSEASVDPAVVESIATETGATIHDDLYGDTLGPADSDAGTYVGMMRHNARVIADGLDG